MTSFAAKMGTAPSALSSNRVIFAAFVAAGIAAIGIGIPAAIGSVALLTLMVQATINGIFATSIGMLIRMNGVVCFGQAAFFGLAVYVVALGFTRYQAAPELVIALALLLPSAAAFLLGLGIVRTPGVAFSMLTLAVGQAMYELFLKARSFTGGDDGFNVSYPATLFGLDTALFQRPQPMFVVCWITLVLVVFGLWALYRSRFGRIAIAIRENEERARFVGYGTRMRRAAALALSALIAGIAGVLMVLYSSYASPDFLHWSVSGAALIMAILGGPKLLWGPAFGAILFFFFKDVVGRYTEHWQAIIGATLIVVTVLLPQGIGGFLAGKLLANTSRSEA